jgi:hypothetical protein
MHGLQMLHCIPPLRVGKAAALLNASNVVLM